jgi:hypothetical protein
MLYTMITEDSVRMFRVVQFSDWGNQGTEQLTWYFRNEQVLMSVFPEAVWLCDARRESTAVINGMYMTEEEIAELDQNFVCNALIDEEI